MVKAKTILLIIGILIGIFFVYSYFYNQAGCTITIEDLKVANATWEGNPSGTNAFTQIFWYKPKLWLKQNIFLCKDESGSFFDKTKGFFKDILGANENIYGFVSDLLVGAMTGLWLWIMYLIVTFRIKKSPALAKVKAGWLEFIGSNIWKIIPIAVAYAVLMQIPIVNSFIKVITFEVLLWLRGSDFLTSVWNAFLRSLIIAFYIGLLPTIIEEYTRYRIRKRYYAAIQRIKFEKKAVEAMTSG